MFSQSHLEYFRKRQKELQLSDRDLAEAMECSPSYICLIKSGERHLSSAKAVDMRQRLMDALQIEERTVFVEKPPKNGKRKP